MEKLTHEQIAWALRWAVAYLKEHEIKEGAAAELAHCAKHFQESHDRNAADNAGK
jgi:hypothetical protein